MSIAVITVVAGRHDHLAAQRRFLGSCARHRHVVVAVDDPEIDEVVTRTDLPTTVLHLAAHPAGLPVAAARNAGARAALGSGADLLVFLDVDCLPAPDLLDRYATAAVEQPGAVLCGPVTYLPPAAGWTAQDLRDARRPHPARPDPPAAMTEPLAPDLFWSLSFAVTASSWTRLGGFYEGYVGYGGEDTDLGATAAAVGVPLLMLGRADAFHQHHPVADPPVGHLDDIVRNAAVFRRRHGRTPMAGWMAAFRTAGLVDDADPPRRTRPVRVATVPARHEYLDAVLPPSVERVDVQRVAGWEPDPLLDPDEVRARAGDVDLVHLHFGYDHLTPQALDAWLAAVRQLRIPLAVTVHDLRNPHHLTRDRHDAHLRALLAAADHAWTITAAAAHECLERFGRAPDVVSHPTLLDDVPPRRAARHEALLPLKALRRNVVDPVAIVRATAEGATRAGARARVLVEPAALTSPALDGLAGIDVDLDVTPRLPHAELVERVAAAHACVLPYRWGTHSGWVELCRDLGTAVVAPSCGHYAGQWADVRTYGNDECSGLDAASLATAVEAALTAPRPVPADRIGREAQRDLVRAEHDAAYRRLAGR